MGGKFKIIVSDLHLGAGYEAEGNRLDDFGSDQEFADLLDGIAAESDRDGAEVELIVNGDAFEMLQVPHVDTFDPERAYEPGEYHSSSENDSARKMALIIDGHRLFFAALRRFIQVGSPRRSVTFIKGNHDINLHWDAVQDRIRQAVNARDERASLLTFEERRISREGIYVEHGNQYAEVVDRVDDMEEPHDHDKPGQLALPFGSWFVMDIFNEVERDRYWVDGVKPITALVLYALAYDFSFAARAIATMLRRLPGIIKEGLFEEPGPSESARRADLLRKLEDPEQVEEMAASYSTDESFRTQFNADVVNMLAPPPQLPGADVHPAALASVPDPVKMAEQIQERVHSSLYEMAHLRALEEGASLVSFGHTHEPGGEELPNGATYVNSGTWTWRGDFTGAGKETWKDLFEHPERFTDDRELHYVRIDYDEDDRPVGRLLTHQPGETPPPSPVDEPTLWDRLLGWLRGLWTSISG
ncbi:MAG: hypothetical protein PVH17_03355 [Anaerolineae bacterium]|jgi:UDP-2,3-diacylglucosamine pyrophosphatase LpxH